MRRPEPIFEQALKRLPADRPAYLRRACGGDRALQAELHSLLEANDRFPRLLALPPVSAAPDAPLPPGSVLGEYEVRSELGRGGMGIVYQARDRRTRRIVALKVLPVRLRGDPRRRARLRREARLWAEVRHPMIAAVHALERQGDIDYLVLEFVPGPTLAARLEKGRLGEGETLGVGRGIVLALEVAHGRGIAHLDLKPENVVLPPEGGVKVLDFGLARTLLAGDAPTRLGRSTAGIVTGTPGYASPEQLRGRPGDAASDLFSLGCVLYECLTGRPAFAGATASERASATRRRRPNWDLLPAGTSPALRRVIESCLAPDLRRRPASARSVRRVLEDEIERRAARPRSPEVAPRPRLAKAGRTTNLPVPLDRFFGRTQERRLVHRLLGRERLITLTGPGGCGKSRLAVEAAGSWSDAAKGLSAPVDGVWLVELAGAPRTASAMQAIAAVLGVRERRGTPLRRSLAEDLAGKRLLLVLDNCEHLPSSFADRVADLLARAPSIGILATSRRPLDVPPERTMRLEPLPVPAGDASPEAIRKTPSVRLFLDRAAAAEPGFLPDRNDLAAVADICRRLDGLPLALELAAARVATLPLRKIRQQIQSAVLPRPAEAETAGRHRTLEELVAWSERLLSVDERRLFRRLAVFADPFSLQAAESVGSNEGTPRWAILDRLSALVRHSLVDCTPASADGAEADVLRGTEEGPLSGSARYRMLEVVRRYAVRRISRTADWTEVRRRHRDHFLELVRGAASHARGPEQASWIARLEAVRDDLRDAVEWSARCDPSGPGPQLAASLGWYWSVRGHWSEGIRLLGEVIATSSGPAYPRLHAALWAGNLELNRGALDSAATWYEEVRRGAKRRGYLPLVGSALLNLGAAAILRGDLKRARTLLEEAIPIQRRLNRPGELAILYLNLGVVAEREQSLARAAQFYRRSLALREKLRDPWAVALSLNNLGVVAEKRGRLAEAARLHRRTLRIRRRLDDRRGLAESLHNLAAIDLRRGQVKRAARGFADTLPLRAALGDDLGVIAGLEAVASVIAPRQPGISARLLAQVDVLRRQLSVAPSATATQDREETRRIIGERLSREQAQAEAERGRSLSRDEGIALARAACGSSETPRPL